MGNLSEKECGRVNGEYQVPQAR